MIFNIICVLFCVILIIFVSELEEINDTQAICTTVMLAVLFVYHLVEVFGYLANLFIK